MIIGGVGAQAAISRDGNTIVSDAKDSGGITSAAIWMGGTNWKTLGGVPSGTPLDGTITSAYGVSGDGSAVVGLAWISTGKTHGFRWDASNGMVDLGSLQSDSSRANAISAGGNMVVGWDANPGGGGSLRSYNYLRGILPGTQEQEDQSLALAVSDDGTVVIGNSGWMPPLDAFVYTDATKTIKLSDYLTSHGV